MVALPWTLAVQNTPIAAHAKCGSLRNDNVAPVLACFDRNHSRFVVTLPRKGLGISHRVLPARGASEILARAMDVNSVFARRRAVGGVDFELAFRTPAYVGNRGGIAQSHVSCWP